MTETNETSTEADRPRPGRSRTLLWVLAGVVLVALVVGVAVGGPRTPATLDPDSPEWVVQRYLQAVFDHDDPQAVGYLSAETAARCTTADFREAYVPDDMVADLDQVRRRDDRAEVRVQMRSTAQPLPFEAMNTSIETFVLVMENGSWRITDDPWPLFSCARPE